MATLKGGSNRPLGARDSATTGHLVAPVRGFKTPYGPRMPSPPFAQTGGMEVRLLRAMVFLPVKGICNPLGTLSYLPVIKTGIEREGGAPVRGIQFQ